MSVRLGASYVSPHYSTYRRITALTEGDSALSSQKGRPPSGRQEVSSVVSSRSRKSHDRWTAPGSPTHRGIEFCRPLRGLSRFFGCGTPGSRTHRGDRVLSHAARYLVICWVRSPGFADSPGG